MPVKYIIYAAATDQATCRIMKMIENIGKMKIIGIFPMQTMDYLKTLIAILIVLQQIRTIKMLKPQITANVMPIP